MADIGPFLNKLLAQRGYVVIGSKGKFSPIRGDFEAHSVGSVISGCAIEGIEFAHPFQIAAHTNETDFLEQMRFLLPDEPWETTSWPFYYRVVTD